MFGYCRTSMKFYLRLEDRLLFNRGKVFKGSIDMSTVDCNIQGSLKHAFSLLIAMVKVQFSFTL